MANQFTPVADRFNAAWMPEPNSGCWLWLGSTSASNPSGTDLRPQMNLNGRPTAAYRVSWLLHRGPIPDGMSVCHKCDVSLCVNPAHLFIGTQADNMRDMIAKGRSRLNIGDRSVPAKATGA